MLTVLLSRHGLAAPPDVLLGARMDPALADEGLAQARALAQRLRDVRLDRVIASPQQRAHQTATAIVDGRDIAVEIDPRLMEIDYGRWEGLTYEIVGAHEAALLAAWEADPATVAPPGGETAASMAERSRAFLADLLAQEQPRESVAPGGERRVLVVAHGSLNRVLLGVALGLPAREFRSRLTQDRVNLTVLRYEAGAAPDQGRLVVLNDTSHLVGPGDLPWS